MLSEDESDDGGEELAYREAWSSSRWGVSVDPNADATPLAGRAAQLKQAGNAAFAAGAMLFQKWILGFVIDF